MKLKNTRSILFIHPFGIGDVLFTTHLVSRVRALCPEARLDFLCNRRTEEVIGRHPGVNHVWVLERDEWRARWKESKRLFLRDAAALFGRLRQQRYELAFDLSLSDEYGFWLMLLGVRHRAGFRFRGRGKFLNRTLPLAGYDGGRHVAEYQLDLLGLFEDAAEQKPEGRAETRRYVPTADDAAAALRCLAQAGIPGGARLVGVAPAGGQSWGAQAALKYWPASHYAQLCDGLAAKGLQPLLLGNAFDMPVIEQVRRLARTPFVSLAGSCSLAETAAIMSQCAFIVSNDGGLLHLAAAQNIPTVSFFGPTDHKTYGPYPLSERHLVISRDLDCRPCYQDFRIPPCRYQQACLTQITAEYALKKIEDWSAR